MLFICFMNCCVRLNEISTVYITRQLVWDRRIELPISCLMAGIMTIRPIPRKDYFEVITLRIVKLNASVLLRSLRD